MATAIDGILTKHIQLKSTLLGLASALGRIREEVKEHVEAPSMAPLLEYAQSMEPEIEGLFTEIHGKEGWRPTGEMMLYFRRYMEILYEKEGMSKEQIKQNVLEDIETMMSLMCLIPQILWWLVSWDVKPKVTNGNRVRVGIPEGIAQICSELDVDLSWIK